MFHGMHAHDLALSLSVLLTCGPLGAPPKTHVFRMHDEEPKVRAIVWIC
jgi:hypothetical protein